MKSRIYAFVFVLSFIVSSSIGVVVVNALDSSKICYSNVGSFTSCSNTLSVDDSLAKYELTQKENYDVKNSYSIYFVNTQWSPKVTAGDPVSISYFLTDNHKSEIIYTDDSAYGQRLAGNSLMSKSIQKTSEFYPGKAPTAVLYTRNTHPRWCGTQPWTCKEYVQANEVNVN
ncbi:hypothetical protein [Paenibacillus apiarius]|uniref:hypothetical protein n=1 Tax=Paenibacillus apiarius TaxID=46240 RepID=UPI003B3B5EA3